jgi:hypothetical protein
MKVKTVNDNAQSVLVTYAQGAANLSRREWFKIGYDSVVKNKPYDYDIVAKTDAIAYARGRAFAIWSNVNGEKACRWKNGVLSAAATQRLLKALYDRAVI